MMREILFRGKQKATGMWLCGDLRQWSEKRKGICDYALRRTLDVYPETVGQFTGLIDKNGKQIFEGDILKIARKSDGIGTYYIPPLDYPVNVAVRWDLTGWTWETLCKDKYYIHFPDAWCHFACEVIGNIHDNPELLEAVE